MLLQLSDVTMPVQQHILNWLYSVLTSVCPSLFAKCRIVIVKLLLTLCSLSLPDRNTTM